MTEEKVIRQYLIDNGWQTFYESNNWVHDIHTKDENSYQAISTKDAFTIQVKINKTTAKDVIFAGLNL